MNQVRKLRAGDFVRVKAPDEIYQTLDNSGCVDGLPFMPEMIRFCGNKFRVLYRIEKTCRDTSKSMAVSEFINNDVVFLENVRCSGIDHDGCQRGCMIFWKEQWLKPVNEKESPSVIEEDDEVFLRNSINTPQSDTVFHCQSTALKKATIDLDKFQKIKKVFSDINYGTYSLLKSLKLITVPVYRKILNKFYNLQPAGNLHSTPDESLNLQPGELVEVKPLKEIINTLDISGKNKGLQFTPDMKQFCGRQFKVRNRLDRMIVERSGEMIEVKNTVILENVTCECFYAFGGCPRKELQYWREIWLKRI